MKRWKKFLSGAGMLAVLGVIGKGIGVFYRLPLTNILGAEGMGLYQMIFPLYSLLLAVSSGGLPAAISKYVSELNALNKPKTAVSALRYSIAALAIIGGAATIAVFLFGKNIAAAQGNDKAGIAYTAIAPAILLSGIIACLRGYFQGHLNMLPSGVSQIIEQTIKAIAGLILASLFLNMGVEYGVFGALLGVTLSEVAALLYLAFKYFLRQRKSRRLQNSEFAEDFVKEEKTEPRKILKELYSVALPVTLGSLVIPLSQAVDSFLVINLLVKSGAETTVATSLFGLFNGPVGSLLNMPTVITVALAASLLPKTAFALKSGTDAKDIVDKSVRTCTAVILPCALTFAIVPYPILNILYSGGLKSAELEIAAILLRIESVDLIFIGLIHIASAMMQAANKSGIPVINLFIGALMKAVTTVVLLPIIGIYGAAISNIVCYVTTCALDLVYMKKINKILFSVKQGKIIFCAACFGAILFSYNLFALVFNDFIALVCAGVAALSAYLILLKKTKSILLSEMLS